MSFFVCFDCVSFWLIVDKQKSSKWKRAVLAWGRFTTYLDISCLCCKYNGCITTKASHWSNKNTRCMAPIPAFQNFSNLCPWCNDRFVVLCTHIRHYLSVCLLWIVSTDCLSGVLFSNHLTFGRLLRQTRLRSERKVLSRVEYCVSLRAARGRNPSWKIRREELHYEAMIARRKWTSVLDSFISTHTDIDEVSWYDQTDLFLQWSTQEDLREVSTKTTTTTERGFSPSLSPMGIIAVCFPFLTECLFW